jgi:hypothetical protein
MQGHDERSDREVGRSQRHDEVVLHLVQGPIREHGQYDWGRARSTEEQLGNVE